MAFGKRIVKVVEFGEVFTVQINGNYLMVHSSDTGLTYRVSRDRTGRSLQCFVEYVWYFFMQRQLLTH